MLNKYRQTMVMSWEFAIAYRFNFLFNLICGTLPLIAMIFLWKAIYANESLISGYNLKEIITYFILAKFLTQVMESETIWMISEEIKDGLLSNYLVKPINYFFYWFCHNIANKTMFVIITFIPFFCIAVFLKEYFFIPHNILILSITILSIILGSILYFLIFFCVSLFTFWITEISIFFYTTYMLMEFFSGGILPLDILPRYILNITKHLPFQYTIYFPLNIYLGKINISSSLRGMIIQMFWIGVIYLLIKFIWSQGLKKYQAVGV